MQLRRVLSLHVGYWNGPSAVRPQLQGLPLRVRLLLGRRVRSRLRPWIELRLELNPPVRRQRLPVQQRLDLLQHGSRHPAALHPERPRQCLLPELTAAEAAGSLVDRPPHAPPEPRPGRPERRRHHRQFAGRLLHLRIWNRLPGPHPLPMPTRGWMGTARPPAPRVATIHDLPRQTNGGNYGGVPWRQTPSSNRAPRRAEPGPGGRPRPTGRIEPPARMIWTPNNSTV